MAYVVTEPCIGEKNEACVEVCPVDCIYDVGDHFMINPEECIDCGACEPECPVDAIYPEDEVPGQEVLRRKAGRVRLLAAGARVGRVLVELKERTLDEVKALGREAAVELMRQAGVVGAGGGGFPTYVKYGNPQPHLIVNATESEPGYRADKLIHHQYLDEFLLVFEALKHVFDIDQISLCVHDKDGEWYAGYALRARRRLRLPIRPERLLSG